MLRAIQEGEVERVGGSRPIRTQFRLLAATNVDLERAVKEGSFREDLYYRLNVIPVRLPPLRERIEDLPVLADFFLRRYSARFHKDVRGIAESTLTMLSHHSWPGNIRELENLIERLVAVVDHEFITDEDLPFEFHVVELDRDAIGYQPAGSGVGDVRAEFSAARARAQRLERHADRALPRRAAEHVEVQDGPARNPRARQEDQEITNSK